MIFMTLYLILSFPVLLVVWLAYVSRNFFLSVGHWLLSRRYEVEFSGVENFAPEKNYLIIPNHPALVDPMILVTELHCKGVDVCPLVDESFFSNRFLRHIFSLFKAVRVPDFRRENFRPIIRNRPGMRISAKRAKALSYSILALLTAGENVLLYPSGHISANGLENLGNRQLAHNVVLDLPKDVAVVAVRMRGLWGSMWSRAGRKYTPPFIKTLLKAIAIFPSAFFREKRLCRIVAEDITDRVVEWAKLGRQSFDKKLEEWYNADPEVMIEGAEA